MGDKKKLKDISQDLGVRNARQALAIARALEEEIIKRKGESFTVEARGLDPDGTQFIDLVDIQSTPEQARMDVRLHERLFLQEVNRARNRKGPRQFFKEGKRSFPVNAFKKGLGS